MSAFDRTVLKWLDKSTLPNASKVTVLQRVNVGITAYRGMADASFKLDRKGPLPVDFTLQEHIAKALSRLESGECAPGTALFDAVPAEGEALSVPRATPRRSSASVPAASAVSSAVHVNPVPAAAAAGARAGAAAAASSTNASVAASSSSSKPFGGTVEFVPTFAFGSDSDAPPFAPSSASNGGGAHSDDEESDRDLDEGEDMRRRLTIMKRASRTAISAEVISASDAKAFKAQVVEKPSEVNKRVLKALESHHLFSHLDDADLKTVVDMMALRTAKKGEEMLTKDAPNSVFFVVVVGSCVAPAAQPPKKFNVGSCFGDLGLMYSSGAEDSVEAAMGQTQVCTLQRADYQMILAKASQAKRERYEGFLNNVQFLGALTSTERLSLAEALKAAKYNKGDHLIKYGEEGAWFQIIVEGTVDVIGRDAQGNKVNVCSFKTGDCVGELEFLFKHKTVADVVASSDVVRTAKMTLRHFERLIGSAKEVLERQALGADVYAYYRQKRNEVFGDKA